MSQNNKLKQITVAEMAPHIHSFKAGENKVNKISEWLAAWIKQSLKAGKIKPYDLLPSKGDLAFHTGVSIGTVQNAFRQIEDMGLVESKQRIGTYIKDNSETKLEKLTSKRDTACNVIKRYLVENKYKKGDILISTRKFAQITGISNSTIRMALNALVLEGTLSKNKNTFVISSDKITYTEATASTLVEKIAKKIKKYIDKELKIGDKLPSNTELAKKFKVSVKTIHDSLKYLAKDRIVTSRRGYYGTVVTNIDTKNELYFYEKAEIKIRHYIANNCDIGMKIPPIRVLAEEFEVSPKTIKKALDNLSQEGYLTFARGRYGGTFVTDIPQSADKAYTWLALNPEFINQTEN